MAHRPGCVLRWKNRNGQRREFDVAGFAGEKRQIERTAAGRIATGRRGRAKLRNIGRTFGRRLSVAGPIIGRAPALWVAFHDLIARGFHLGGERRRIRQPVGARLTARNIGGVEFLDPDMDCAGIVIERIRIDHPRPKQLKLWRQRRGRRPSGQAFDTEERYTIEDAGHENRGDLGRPGCANPQDNDKQQRRQQHVGER
jgi:hypothetical protein